MSTELSFDQRETMKRLAQFTHIEIARRSPVVASLVRKGLAKATLLDDRERDQRGRRLVKLELTEEGFHLAIERGWRDRDARGTPFEIKEQVGYFALISCGPLIVVKLPLKGISGDRTVAPAWREVLKAAGEVLRQHGFKKRDLSAIDPISHPDDFEDSARSPDYQAKGRQYHELCAQAFSGSDAALQGFWLYAWNGTKFELARKPVDREQP